MKQLFQEALALPEVEREGYLRESCSGDRELADEVRDLLGHARVVADGFLEGPARSTGAPGPATLSIPGFEILGRLAVGASGAVYRAHQAHPQREVAIKILRLDSLGAGQVARFQREAEILAGLDHPGIARVIESGVLEDGALALPWIALEFVHGETLDRYLDSARLRLKGQLELLVLICDAVEHAHRRGIVHRDLKPSNVMVDQDGRPRVLDFGVARAPLDLDGTTALRTRTGMLIGTLGFMAPEQARGERDLTPAADVYSLGVMLFEFLTGRLPIEVDERELLDAARAISDEEPVPLRRLRPDLPRDLETVLAKTLEKDPARRYRTAGELGEELRRFLGQRPVHARRATITYRLGKLVRRNPALFLSIAAVGLALATGLGLALAGLGDGRRESARTTAALDAFAAKMLHFTGRLGFGEEERADLEEVLALVEDQLGRDPTSRSLRDARAQFLTQLAILDQARADFAAMEAHLEQARVGWERLVEEGPGDLASWTQLSACYARLGEAAHAGGRGVEREAWYARALALDERLVSEHPGDAELIEDLGWSLERMARTRAENGETDTALRLNERRLRDAEELVLHEPGNWKFVYNLAHVHYYLSGLHRGLGDLEAARVHSSESVRLARQLCEIQPSRRDALKWLVDTCRGAREVMRALGELEAARELAVEAVDRAADLLMGDPTRPEHLTMLSQTTKELVRGEPASERLAAARRTGLRLNDLAALLDHPGWRGVAENVRAIVPELEASARSP